MEKNSLYHHGILGMHWGTRNGPPYPLSAGAHSASEKKAGYQKSIDGGSQISIKRTVKGRPIVTSSRTLKESKYKNGEKTTRELKQTTYSKLKPGQKVDIVTKEDFQARYPNGSIKTDLYEKVRTGSSPFKQKLYDNLNNLPDGTSGKVNYRRYENNVDSTLYFERVNGATQFRRNDTIISYRRVPEYYVNSEFGHACWGNFTTIREAPWKKRR